MVLIINYKRLFQNFSKHWLHTDTFARSNEIKLYLQQKHIKFYDGWTCFQCSNFFQNNNKSHDLQKFCWSNYYINKTTGDFNCPRNNHCGSWKTLKNLFEKHFEGNTVFDADLLKNKDEDAYKIKEMWKLCQPLNKLDFEKRKTLLQKYDLLCIENADLNILDKFNICCKTDNELVIPFYSNIESNYFPKGLKIINDPAYCSEANMGRFSSYTLISSPTNFEFFGFDKLSLNTKTIVLTSNEFDAIVVNSFSSKYLALSLPFGISNLPLRLLPLVEKFSEIILWFGNDFMSVEAAQLFANKLGSTRCRIVLPSALSSTALSVAKCGLNIDDILNSAKSKVIKNVVTFSDLHEEVMDEILNKQKYAGVTFKRFSDLNMILKGHRPGELTILTGPTGSGKTTLLSELSLDLALQGVRTLWGSFELSNKRLLISMLKQYSEINLNQNLHMLEEICQKFKQIPITFMSYNGSKHIDEVLKTMFEATYYYDIQHIVLDNLQFMMGNVFKMDRFAYQDHIINQLRQFATKHHVHITLVVHPRKEYDNMPLQLSSVFGSAKATQEADNVLILQVRTFTSPNKHLIVSKCLEVAKNRYDGELGSAKLYFNKHTLQMSKYTSNIADIKNGVQFKQNTGLINNSSSQTLKHDISVNNSVSKLVTIDKGNDSSNETTPGSSSSWINRFRSSSN